MSEASDGAAGPETGTDAGARPRLGFVGVGWIAGLRLDALEEEGGARIAALCEPDPGRLDQRREAHPGAAAFSEYDELLHAAPGLGIDGVVLSTPNHLHAPQALRALERGLPVFVQKPLGLDAAEVEEVLAAARRADRRVGVDYTYRGLAGAFRLREWIRSGELGEVFLVEAAFHNAYGPDKEWCFDRARSGGGALLDLGVHWIDLVSWLSRPEPSERAERGGRVDGAGPEGLRGWIREVDGPEGIDGFAGAEYRLGSDGPRVRLACSWNAHAGRDCDAHLTVHGSRGGARLENVDGSFYDFRLLRRDGRSEEVRAADEGSAWMVRPLLEWAAAVADDPAWDPEALRSLEVARTVDAVYRSAGLGGGGP